MNQEIARVSIASTTGMSASVALTAPSERADWIPWMLECRSSGHSAGEREWSRTIGAGYAGFLLRELDRAWVPARPDALMDRDGSTYELSLTQGSSKVVYHWRGVAPKGYESVVAFCNVLFELGGIGVEIDPPGRG